MFRCCYAVVIALLLVGCRTKEEVAKAELDMTSWQTHLESRVDSMVRTMVWEFDSLVITELAPDAPASTPDTPKRQLSAKRAKVSVDEERVATTRVLTERADSTHVEAHHTQETVPVSRSLPVGTVFVITLIIIYILCQYRR